jgi:hypothetical protein
MTRKIRIVIPMIVGMLIRIRRRTYRFIDRGYRSSQTVS